LKNNRGVYSTPSAFGKEFFVDYQNEGRGRGVATTLGSVCDDELKRDKNVPVHRM
jgi:hypothetical protein